MEIFVCSREFFYESPGETILKITPSIFAKVIVKHQGVYFFLDLDAKMRKCDFLMLVEPWIREFA